MSSWIAKLDEFIDRQGIKSSELCVIVDNIEKEIEALKVELQRERECVDFYAEVNKVTSKDDIDGYHSPTMSGGLYLTGKLARKTVAKRKVEI